MAAFFTLGPWEVIIILAALAVLLGVPVLVMAAVVGLKRIQQRGPARRKAKEP